MSDELSIVDGFFEAALSPELWAQNLGRLSDYIGGAAVNMILIEKPAAAPVDLHFERVDEGAYARYISDYIAVDPRIPRILGAPINTLLLEHHLLTEEEKRSGAIYSELLAHSGMRNQAITLLSADGIFAGFGVAPQNDSEAFDRQQLARLTRLLPHLRHAVRFHIANLELQLHRASLGELWSQAGKGVLILNGRRKALFCNQTAEVHLQSGLLSQFQGQVSFAEKGSDAAFRTALSQLLQPGAPRASEFLAVHPVSMEQFGVRLVSAGSVLSSLQMLKAPAVVLLITPLGDSLVIGAQEIARFGQLFGITAAETAVVAAVAAGHSLRDHAAQGGIALDTARKQLKAAMAKCGVTSQKDLISRLERFCFLTGS